MPAALLREDPDASAQAWQGGDRGRDGPRVRVRDMAGRRTPHLALRLIPRHFALLAIAPSGEATIARFSRPSAARLPKAVWPTIAARADHESLRDLAADYGVSHETIRAIVRAVDDANEAAL